MIFAVVIVLNVIVMVSNIIFENPPSDQILGDFISGIQFGLFIAFIMISVTFVLLSREGYFPEDLKSKKVLEKEHKFIQKAQEEGYPLSKKTGRPLKPYIKPLEEIIGGGIGLITGVFFITQPVFVGLLDPLFSLIIRIIGVLLIIESTMDISRGIIGNHKPSTHQIIYGVKVVLKFVGIPFIIFLALNPQIFPWFNYNEISGKWGNQGVSVDFYGILRSLMIVFAVLTGFITLKDIYRIVKLQNYK